VDLDLDHPVLVFACDVDGCLAAVGHAAYDLQTLHAIVELNRASEDDPTVPALTLVTGRPHPYVDALTQALDLRLPVSFENGAGLATRDPYEAWLLPEAQTSLAALRRCEELVEERDDVFIQYGKVASLSVFPTEDGPGVPQLTAELRALIEEHGLELIAEPSASDCVNVLLPGVDKSLGLSALLDALDLPEAAVAGIGDAVGDVAWLRRCGVSFAPAGAGAEVKQVVTRVSPFDDAAAVLEAYRALVAANRTLSGRRGQGGSGEAGRAG
jgi:hydroxymethylpyrimidine pyrophosphatase-like HAD family hydrolase